ncbi:hypothetical protein CBX96_13420 [Shewanella sp. BC20]|nr:hypothetical protein CBX96_13420 [Shewanella sp. BC20]
MSKLRLDFQIKIKVKVVGLHPTPNQKGKNACSPFGNPPASLAKLHALVSGLGLMGKLLSLPKDASLHLRKLAGHP